MRPLGQLTYLLLTLGVDAIRVDRFVGDDIFDEALVHTAVEALSSYRG
jgi:hypothetical protein